MSPHDTQMFLLFRKAFWGLIAAHCNQIEEKVISPCLCMKANFMEKFMIILYCIQSVFWLVWIFIDFYWSLMSPGSMGNHKVQCICQCIFCFSKCCVFLYKTLCVSLLYVSLCASVCSSIKLCVFQYRALCLQVQCVPRICVFLEKLLCLSFLCVSTVRHI